MRRAALLLVVLLAAVLQATLLPALRPLGVVPDLALVMVVLVGLESTATTALVAAVAGGLVLDMAGGANFGMWTVILVLAALAAGLIHRAGIELVGPAVALVMVAAGTVLSASVVLGGLAGSNIGWPMGVLLGRLAGELVLNLILTMMLRPLVRRVMPAPEQMGVVR